MGSEDEEHTLHSAQKKKRRRGFQCFAVDSVSFDNDKISNHDGHFHHAVLYGEMLAEFTLHEKRNKQPVEKSFFRRYFRRSRLRGQFCELQEV